MGKEYYLIMAIGTITMATVMFLNCRYYKKIHFWKILLNTIVLLCAGVLGTKIMFLIENGFWGGTSFYGAVFFAPVIMILLALLIQIQWSSLLDLCAPAECTMLACMKGHCYIAGCCYGRVLWMRKSGTEIRFPSQIAELINALLLMLLLMYLIRNGKWKGKIYPLYLLTYGGSRFLLNLLRETDAFLMGLPAGNFWSLIAMLIGAVWLFCAGRFENFYEKGNEVE